jgi:hypothetical protein
MRKTCSMWLFPFFLLLFTSSLSAHVGSPDVFYEGAAGPYRLMVTIRPPLVIPGVAEIEVVSASSELRELQITPLHLSGPGAQFAPTPDRLQKSSDASASFTGSLWLMEQGAWQVRIQAEGPRGQGELSVPVPAVAQQSLRMQKFLAVGLFILMLFLSVGAVSVVGASLREGQLEPGVAPGTFQIRRARLMMAATAVLLFASLFLARGWWNSIAQNYERRLYKLPQLSATLEPQGRLTLRLPDPGLWKGLQITGNPLIPDHNHLMHLFLVRLPELERFWHLHPEQMESAVFSQDLPAIPAGRYQIFADVVHRSGFPETMVTEIDLPYVPGKPLSGDDSAGVGRPLSQADRTANSSELFCGGRMVWERDSLSLKSRHASWFRFRVEDQAGRPVDDLEPYMGMAGHAVFLKTDRSVFAHVHPSGTPPMAMLALTERGATSQPDPHARHGKGVPAFGTVVSFPYGFPQPGEYRIFVQIKRVGRVQTGVFDVEVGL